MLAFKWGITADTHHGLEAMYSKEKVVPRQWIINIKSFIKADLAMYAHKAAINVSLRKNQYAGNRSKHDWIKTGINSQ